MDNFVDYEDCIKITLCGIICLGSSLQEVNMECYMCSCECGVPPLIVRGREFCCWECVYQFFNIKEEDDITRTSDAPSEG